MRQSVFVKCLAVVVVAAMLIPACVTPVVRAQSPAPEKDPANAERTLVWIPKTTNSTFWLAVHEGAKKAAAELGYKEVLYKGMPSQTDIAGQVNLVNDMVSAKAAGIMIAATDAKALADPVEKAIAAGVPVVTLDSGVDSEKPYAYIATDNIAAAKTAADVLGELIGGKGTVGDIGITAGSQTGIEREQGFVDEMAAKYADVKVLPVQYTGCDPAKSLNIASDMMTGNPETVGFYGACDGPGTGIGQLVKQRDLVGKVRSVSFDVSPDQFLLFLDGYLDALIVQDPFQMGYRGVYAIDQAIHNQPVTDKMVAIPAKVVTKDNLSQPEIYDLLASYGDIKSILEEKGIQKAEAAPAATIDPANAERTLVWIPKTTNSTFWLAVHEGAKKAAAELGYKEVLYKGMPSQTDIAGQVNLVNDMVSAKAAGIMIAATDAKALADPVEKAIAAGVPVVTLDSGVDSDKPYAYIATDNIAAAKTAADVLGELIGGKGTVGDIGITAGSQTGIEREQGFVDEMAAKFVDVKVLPVQYTGCDPAKSLNIASDMMTGNPETVGFYGACDGPGTGIGQLVKQRDLVGKVRSVSFDVSPDQFLLFLDGYLDALIVQDPFQMGYRGVYAIDQAIHNQPVTDKMVAIPAKVVTKDNLSQPEIYDLLASYGDINSILEEKGIQKGG